MLHGLTRLFDTNTQPNEESFNAVVDAYARNSNHDGVQHVIEMMQRSHGSGAKPSAVTYSAKMIHAVSRLKQRI